MEADLCYGAASCALFRQTSALEQVVIIRSYVFTVIALDSVVSRSNLSTAVIIECAESAIDDNSIVLSIFETSVRLGTVQRRDVGRHTSTSHC
jgi:hypothetical protein